MRAYRVTTDGACSTFVEQYKTTRDLAHDCAKVEVPGFYHENVRIELVELNNDQATLCLILSGERPEMKVIKTWALTPRRGLKEVANGD